ncbi:hypothetical protein AGMMS50249_0850 [candidate division SR1 bacterium]|nr:hypothetical protein AGMMS50249_0850 [candidate division SR1 bacterium]
MTTNLITIGNSQGIRIPKTLIQMYNLDGGISLSLQKHGLLITPSQKSRNSRKEQFETALSQGKQPEKADKFEFQENDFDNQEREW